jgi:hypothetical protein
MTELAIAGRSSNPRGAPRAGFEAGASALARPPLLALGDITASPSGGTRVPGHRARGSAAQAVVILTSERRAARGPPSSRPPRSSPVPRRGWPLPQATGWLLSLGLGHVAGLDRVACRLTGVR